MMIESRKLHMFRSTDLILIIPNANTACVQRGKNPADFQNVSLKFIDRGLIIPKVYCMKHLGKNFLYLLPTSNGG